MFAATLVMEILRRLLARRSVRFIVVGAFNTGFSYLVYATGLYVGLSYALANFASLVLGILFSFKTQGALVFRNTDNRLIVRFALCWLVVFFVNIAFLSLLIRGGLNAYWSGALALMPMALLSFVIQKFVVFGAARRPADTASH